MRLSKIALFAGLIGCTLASFAEAEEKAAAAKGPRRDPAGIKGISPFWEAIKKGDDAFTARDLDGAIAAYKEALGKDPQNPTGHYRMGEAMITKGDMAEARAALETAKRFAGRDATLKGKILFVLADLSERERKLNEATNGWNAYEAHAKSAPAAKTYPATAADRKQRIEQWNKLEQDYAAVKERIKKRLEEAEAGLKKG